MRHKHDHNCPACGRLLFNGEVCHQLAGTCAWCDSRLVWDSEQRDYRVEFRDPCEYCPEHKRAAYNNEVHAEADFVVGADGKWRLCADCAALPEFAHFRRRVPIRRQEPKEHRIANVTRLEKRLADGD